MSTHSLEETEAFLQRNGIPDDVIQNFQINSITLDMAPEINETYLRDLCPQIGTRIKLKKVLQIYIDSQADTSSCTSGGENNSILDHNISLNEINNVTVTLFRERAEFPDFDLKTLLMTSALGNSILNHYTSQGTLDGKRRSMLTDIVIRHLYTRIVNCRMTHEEYNFIAAKIVSLFPTETVGTYFVKPVRKQDSKRGKPLFAKGKLVDKVRNILYMSGERKRKICDEGESSQKSFTEDDLQKSVVSENHQAELLWLKTNINPWQEVQRLWHETYEDRRHMENASVHDFLKNFKILEDPRCEDLINYDFNRLYPNKSMCFYTNWETFFKTLMQLKEKELTEQCRLFIDMTATIDDEEKKLPLQMEIFGHLVPPKGRLNRKVKFSILESIEGLVVKVQTTGDIEKKICDLKEKANKKNRQFNPTSLWSETITIGLRYILSWTLSSTSLLQRIKHLTYSSNYTTFSTYAIHRPLNICT